VAPPAPPPPKPVAAAAPKDEALPVIRQTRPATPVPAVPSAAALARPDAKPAAAAASASGETRIYALAELPDEIRRQLPALSVGGSAYSKRAADRILIVNGQVLHEGDKVAPELVLQQIKLRAAVLAFKGYRYEIAY
jgi:general secretion pathway protein B